jgi:hypothetical protein
MVKRKATASGFRPARSHDRQGEKNPSAANRPSFLLPSLTAAGGHHRAKPRRRGRRRGLFSPSLGGGGAGCCGRRGRIAWHGARRRGCPTAARWLCGTRRTRSGGCAVLGGLAAVVVPFGAAAAAGIACWVPLPAVVMQRRHCLAGGGAW